MQQTQQQEADCIQKISSSEGVENYDESSLSTSTNAIQKVLKNLLDVETGLQMILEEHRHGQHGFVTREWGFQAPGGLGGALGGKFQPWEDKLAKVPNFFWPMEAYASMEEFPYGKPDPKIISKLNLKPEGERLYGNIPLYEYLMKPPCPEVILNDAMDLDSYRNASKIFILLGTLSHLCGNASPDPKSFALPEWIEDPLIRVAKRLDVEPTLTGHFLVQENWIWRRKTKTDVSASAQPPLLSAEIETEDPTQHQHNHPTAAAASSVFSNSPTTGGPKNNKGLDNGALLMKEKKRQYYYYDLKIIQTLLEQCQVEDRRYRIKIYPQCFVGSQAIDVIIENGYAQSRIDAVHVGRRINQTYKVFQHVCDDHLLMDKHLFYRFRPKWKNNKKNNMFTAALNNNDNYQESIPNSLTLKEEEVFKEVQQQQQKDQDQESQAAEAVEVTNEIINNQKEEDVSVTAPRIIRPSDLFGGNSGHSKGGGGSLSLWSISGHSTGSKGTGGAGASSSLFSTLRSMASPSSRVQQQQQQNKFVKSGQKASIKEDDDPSFFFSEEIVEDALHPAEVSSSATQQHYLQHHDDNDHEDNDCGQSHEHEEIMAALGIMKKYISVKDRRYRLRVYKKCFIGSQLIDVLLEHDLGGRTRHGALRLARRINALYNIIEHVCNHHELKDEYLFYRFTSAFSECSQISVHHPFRSVTGNADNNSTSKEVSQIHTDDSGCRSFQDLTKKKQPAQLVLDENQEKGPGVLLSLENTSNHSAGDSNSVSSMASYTRGGNYDMEFGLEEEGREEFRFENIDMLYPAFRNNHERVNQLIPACMGYAMRSLPFLILDILNAMRDLLLQMEMELETTNDGNRKNMKDNNNDDTASSSNGTTNSVDSYEIHRLSDLIYQLAFSCSRCKEQFQLMTTDPTKRTFNSKHVSIRQTQPLSNGVRVRRNKNGEPLPSKGTTGTQFPYFHLLDWLLGRYHNFTENDDLNSKSTSSLGLGLVAKISAVDDTYPRPQREYIRCLSTLQKSSTLRGFLHLTGYPQPIMTAYNHLMECYAGEGGILQAHCRKLYSYIHNDVQSSTSGTNHVKAKSNASGSTDACSSSGKEAQGNSHRESGKVCPAAATMPVSSAKDNHMFANLMFRHMRSAAEERWRLRIPPLMTQVKKVVYSTSESGGFTTVALDLTETGLRYEYGDVVKALLPNDEKTAYSWSTSLSCNGGLDHKFFKLSDMQKLHKETGNGWGWLELWEALGWSHFEDGVPLQEIARYIEQGQIREGADKQRWIKCPLDLCCNKGESKIFAPPPVITRDQIASLEPVSPRIYSVSGVEADRVFLLVSKPLDGARHHGYERMADSRVETVHCSFAPATAFLVPPKNTNLVCIASGTGISPFVGLADMIGARKGTYTIAHQCKSSDLFLSNCQNWLDFTALNPGAVVMGFISGDCSRRNCPMRYIIRNGAFEETSVLGRHCSSAYYFQCPHFTMRLKEVYNYQKDKIRAGGRQLNLAYCCGGVKSAIQPFKDILSKENMEYEFTVESYGVPSTLNQNSVSSQIGGTIVNLDHVAPIHPGGDQILYQIQNVAIEEKDDHHLQENKKQLCPSFCSTTAGASGTPASSCPVVTVTPDLSELFWQLHPHAYNLHRCLRAPLDADSDAFTAFLERQAMRDSTMFVMASRYAEVALAAPNDSKVVRIASELQSSTIHRQVQAGDIESAKQSASYLEELLSHVPSNDEDAKRWNKVLDEYKCLKLHHNDGFSIPNTNIERKDVIPPAL